MTAQATHTPGPWRIYENPNLEPDDAHAIGVTMDTRGRDMRNDVAACNLLGLDLDECKANARLIAAAPDLLEALKQALVYAENEAEHLSNCENRDDEDFGSGEAWDCVHAARQAIAKAEGRAGE